jgi:hypothetical protein
MRRAMTAVLAALLAGAPAAAQDADDLTGLLDSLATLWEQNDAARLVGLGADVGLELDVHGTPMGPLAGRRAAAALRHLFQAQETVAVLPNAASRVVGTDDRAFVEMTWEVRQEGAVMTERSTVFMGLVREPRGWRVSQIRILP